MNKLLGLLLIDSDEITTSQLAEALNYQDKNGGFLGEILIKMGYIDKNTLEKYLKKQEKLK